MLAATPHAMDLPEILALVSLYLTHRDLYACIQISYSFHRAFAPSLWSTILVQPLKFPKHCFRFPSQQAITRYKHIIQGLYILEALPHNYLTASDNTLRELRVSTFYNVRYDSGVYNGTVPQLMKAITMNSNSLQHLHVSVAIPDKYVEKNRELWETLTTCRQLKTLKIASLLLSLNEMQYFKEICGAGDDDVNGARLSYDLAAALPQRSVKLTFCPFDEWPDEAYDDESLALPRITSGDFHVEGSRDRVRMSAYGHGKIIRKCLHLESLRWHSGDFRADVLRAKLCNYEGKKEDDWFFGGLLGDISEGPERQWRIVRNMQDGVGSAVGVWCPYLDTIELGWKQIPDLTCARFLKRLYRLETLQWRNPLLGHLSIEELF